MSAGWVVAKACEAQEALSTASEKLIAARVDVQRVVDEEAPRELVRRMHDLAAKVIDFENELDPIIAEIAALVLGPGGKDQ